MLYAIDKGKARISVLRNDAEFERLIERTEALNRSIEETDTETIPLKFQEELLL